MARLARTAVARLPDGIEPGASLLAALRAQAREAAPAFDATSGKPEPFGTIGAMIFDGDTPGTLADTLRSVHRVARAIRDRLSSDTWRVITALDQEMRDAETWAAAVSTTGGVSALLDRLIALLAALSGLVMDSMSRGHGWRFLDMGRRLERALSLALTLDATLTSAQPSESLVLESLLEAADSAITYRRRYLPSLHAAAVLDLLLADETNPRSVVFQLARARAAQVDLAGRANEGSVGRRAAPSAAVAHRGAVRRLAARPDARRLARRRHGRARARAARAVDALSPTWCATQARRSRGSRARAERQRRRSLQAQASRGLRVIHHVVHVTEYLYSEPVSTSHHDLHLLPRATPEQSCLHESAGDRARPAVRREHVDDSATAPPTSRFTSRTTSLTVMSHAEVERHAAARRCRRRARRGRPCATRCARAASAEVRAAATTCSRRRTSPTPALTRVTPCRRFHRGPPLIEAARGSRRRIHAKDFIYDGHRRVRRPSTRSCACAAASARTSPTSRSRCLRSLGLPARYVSGYLLTHPAARQAAPRRRRRLARLAVGLRARPRLGRFRPDQRLVPSDQPHHGRLGPRLRRRHARSTASSSAAATTQSVGLRRRRAGGGGAAGDASKRVAGPDTDVGDAVVAAQDCQDQRRRRFERRMRH